MNPVILPDPHNTVFNQYFLPDLDPHDPDSMKKVYRRLAKKYHPDKASDTTVFSEIASCYDTCVKDKTVKNEIKRMMEERVAEGSRKKVEQESRKRKIEESIVLPNKKSKDDIYTKIKEKVEPFTFKGSVPKPIPKTKPPRSDAQKIWDFYASSVMSNYNFYTFHKEPIPILFYVVNPTESKITKAVCNRCGELLSVVGASRLFKHQGFPSMRKAELEVSRQLAEKRQYLLEKKKNEERRELSLEEIMKITRKWSMPPSFKNIHNFSCSCVCCKNYRRGDRIDETMKSLAKRMLKVMRTDKIVYKPRMGYTNDDVEDLINKIESYL